jgi:hypothetical protein
MNLSKDCREFIALLRSEGVEFLIVGAAALAAHGRPRYSGDVDFWIRCDADTAAKMERVIEGFGFASTRLKAADFAAADQVIQLGVAPNRIDILTGLTALKFDDAWAKRIDVEIDGVVLPVLDRESFRINKAALGRNKDLADIEDLV